MGEGVPEICPQAGRLQELRRRLWRFERIRAKPLNPCEGITAKIESAMKAKRIRVIVIAVLVALGLVVAGGAAKLAPLIREHGHDVSLGRQWAGVLREHAIFSAKPPENSTDASFTYAAASDENLKKLRETYRLDAIAGKGPEIERIVNLMSWVFRLTGHASEPEIPEELNAFNLSAWRRWSTCRSTAS